MSGLLSDEESLKINKKLYKNGDLILLYDHWTLESNKCSIILSQVLSNILRLQASQIFVFNHTLDNPVQEYIKMLTLLPVDILLEYKWCYVKGTTLDIGYGVILNVKVPENVNCYDHLEYFIIDNSKEQKIQKVKPNIAFKKTILKLNYSNELTKDNPLYNTLLMAVSNNIELTNELLLEIYENYKDLLNYNKLLFEVENEKSVIPDLTNDLNIITTSVIEDKLILPNILLPVYKNIEYQIDSIQNLFDIAFDYIFDYLNLDFSNYITNDIELIQNKLDIHLDWNNNIYLITTDDFILKTIIKFIVQINTGIPISIHDYIIFDNSELSLTNIFDVSTLIELLEQYKKETSKFINDNVRKINTVLKN